MNVAGITQAPVAPPAPTIQPVGGSKSTEPHPQQRQAQTDAKASQQKETPHRSAPKAPPIKPLSTTEMRVMMGGLPPDVLFEGDAGNPARAGKGRFDGYA